MCMVYPLKEQKPGFFAFVKSPILRLPDYTTLAGNYTFMNPKRIGRSLAALPGKAEQGGGRTPGVDSDGRWTQTRWGRPALVCALGSI